MKTYKAVQVLNVFSPSELEVFASLFSSKQSVISNDKSQFICIEINPDHYLLNKDEISELFKNNYFKPLVVTNYKLLSLLLVVAKRKEFQFTDFSFKESGEEAETEKIIVKDMLSESSDVLDISSFLKENSQKIHYLELEISNSKNRMRIYSNGNISLTNSFDKNLYPLITNVIQFLFTGSFN